MLLYTQFSVQLLVHERLYSLFNPIWIRMNAFGLENAPSVLQRLMQQVLVGIVDQALWWHTLMTC